MAYLCHLQIQQKIIGLKYLFFVSFLHNILKNGKNGWKTFLFYFYLFTKFTKTEKFHKCYTKKYTFFTCNNQQSYYTKFGSFMTEIIFLNFPRCFLVYKYTYITHISLIINT